MDDSRACAIADELSERDLRVAVAESLTGGLLCSQLAKAPRASSWLVGGVVAYTPEVKHQLLGVPPGPVVTEEAACQMARGVSRLLGSDVAVSVTGVGGPDAEEGNPPGTVWIGFSTGDDAQAELAEIDGDPPEILQRTVDEALRLLERHLLGLSAGAGKGDVPRDG